jgi:hypothetical protein
MSDIEQRFHETWLGMVQPTEGLVVSLPVLLEAQCMERHPPSLQHGLLALCTSDDQGASPRIGDLPRFLAELLKLTPGLWDAATGYHPEVHWGGTLPEALAYYAAEGA